MCIRDRIAVIGLTVILVGRKRVKRQESENTLESELDWIDQMVEETAPSEPELPPEPLPEEEELRAWARGEREVQDWQDRVPGDDILELE